MIKKEIQRKRKEKECVCVCVSGSERDTKKTVDARQKKRDTKNKKEKNGKRIEREREFEGGVPSMHALIFLRDVLTVVSRRCFTQAQRIHI